MNTNRTLLVFMVVCLWIEVFYAQQPTQSIDSVQNSYENAWGFGAGVNVVDDSGELIGGIANPSENWMFSMPFYVGAEYYIKNEFSVSAMFSTNKYTEGKVYNGMYILGEGANYRAVDLAVKFSFRKILESSSFDPYGFIGLGYSSIGAMEVADKDNSNNVIQIPSSNRINYNVGLGINYWVSANWGVNLNLVAKLGLNKGNHKQYTFGLVYLLRKK